MLKNTYLPAVLSNIGGDVLSNKIGAPHINKHVGVLSAKKTGGFALVNGGGGYYLNGYPPRGVVVSAAVDT